MSLSTLAETLQWGLIAVLAVLVLFLVRQVAALSALLRDGRASVAQSAVRPHLPLGRQSVVAADGSAVELGAGRAVLLLFLSEGCSTCRGMREALGALGEKVPADDLELAFVEDDPPPGAAGRAHALRNDAVPPVLVPDSPAPAAVALAPDGRVAAVGTPRVAEHLLEMSRAARYADSSSERHMVKHHIWGDAIPSWEPGSEIGPS